MTVTARIEGTIPPVVTPLTPDGDVDVASLERLTEYLIDGGVDGLFALGSSGEAVFLTDPQRDLVLEVITRTAAGRVPVLAGCIETTTPRVVQRVHAAEKVGAAGLVLTAPFYAVVGPAEIERHFRAVAATTTLPLLAYDIPVCVRVKLGNDLVMRLAEEDVIAGVKDSSGDDVAFRRLISDVTTRGLTSFAALTGHEVVVDAMLLAGAAGSVPGLGNVDPMGYARLHAAAARGDWPTARREQDRLTRLFQIVDAADPATSFGATRGVGAFKTALMLLGVIASNAVSLPMRPFDEDETGRVREHLVSAGLL